jgi:regulatory protein
MANPRYRQKKPWASKERARSAGGENSNPEADDTATGKASQRPAKPKKPWNPMNYLLWLQARREHSREELRQKLVFKLKEKDLVDQHDPEALLDRMVELNIQSDQRFLEGQVRMASTGGRGPGWIKQRIYRHKLDSESVSEALGSVDDEVWEKEAYALAQRRYGVGPYPMPLRMKAGNFLIRRGYSIDLARKITGNTWPGEEDKS